MVTIWKYEIYVVVAVQRFDMPVGSKVIKVGHQRKGILTFWALVDPDLREMEVRQFRVLPTGGFVPDNCTYLGTCLDSELVWHLFEEI